MSDGQHKDCSNVCAARRCCVWQSHAGSWFFPLQNVNTFFSVTVVKYLS